MGGSKEQLWGQNLVLIKKEHFYKLVEGVQITVAKIPPMKHSQKKRNRRGESSTGMPVGESSCGSSANRQSGGISKDQPRSK
jgi:hypothetical protein